MPGVLKKKWRAKEKWEEKATLWRYWFLIEFEVKLESIWVIIIFFFGINLSSFI